MQRVHRLQLGREDISVWIQSTLDPLRNQCTLWLSIKIEREGVEILADRLATSDLNIYWSVTVASDSWYDNWFDITAYLPACQMTPFSAGLSCQIELTTIILACTFLSDWNWTGWWGQTIRHQTFVKKITFWHFKYKSVLKVASDCNYRICWCLVQVWLLTITSNSLKLTETDEGPRVWLD